MPTLADFLTTGKLGRIAVGVSKADVRQILGDPEDVSVQKNPEIWKYGALELSFYRERENPQARLVLLAVYFHKSEDAVPAALGMTGWLPSKNTTFQEIEQFLATLNGTAGVNRFRESDGDLIVENSGMRIVFDEGKIHSIIAATLGSTRRRQISVSIPEDVLAVIRQEAAQRKVSVSTLCAEWIEEQVMSRSRAL